MPLAEQFSALSDPNRLKIFELVAQAKRLPVSQICKSFTITAPAVSQHLKVLRDAHLLKVEKYAQQRFYSINEDGVQLIDAWLRKMEATWTGRFERLDQILKQENAEEKERDAQN